MIGLLEFLWSLLYSMTINLMDFENVVQIVHSISTHLCYSSGPWRCSGCASVRTLARGIFTSSNFWTPQVLGSCISRASVCPRSSAINYADGKLMCYTAKRWPKLLLQKVAFSTTDISHSRISLNNNCIKCSCPHSLTLSAFCCQV